MATVADRSSSVQSVPAPEPCTCNTCPPCRARSASLAWIPGPERSVRAIQSRKAVRTVRRGWKEADRQGTAFRLPVDLDRVNAELSLAADAELAARIEIEGAPIDLPALLDQAERAGWEGADLTIPAGLTAELAAEYAAVWASGRQQRTEDERALTEARFRYYDELWEAEERGRRDAEMHNPAWTAGR